MNSFLFGKMSVQSGLETLNHMEQIGDQLSINPDPILRSSFKEKTDSLPKSTHSVTFENPTQETIRRDARKLLVSSNPSTVNELLSLKSNDLKKEKPKQASKTVQRSLSAEPAPVSKSIKRSVKFENIPSTPKIKLSKEEENEYINSETNLEQNDDFLHENQTTFLSSNAASVILVLIFIIFTKLFL